MHTWHVLRIRTVSNADGLYRAYNPSTAGSVTVRQYWTWLYGLKAKMCIGDRPYFYKEVPDLTILVNEAKKFGLTKTKFSSHRHEISSYITNFRFDSSPRLRNIRWHFRTINAPKFRRFFVWTEGLNFLVKIREFRSYWRSSAYTSHLYSTVLSKRCFTVYSGNAAMRKKIQTCRHWHWWGFIKLFPWIPTA